MNTSLARKLLNAMLAAASVGACLFVMDSPRPWPQAPGPVGSNVLDETQALKQILMTEVPTPWPPAPGLRVGNMMRDEKLRLAGAWMIADTPTPWPPAPGHVTNDGVGAAHAPTVPVLMSDSPTPWPQLTNDANV